MKRSVIVIKQAVVSGIFLFFLCTCGTMIGSVVYASQVVFTPEEKQWLAAHPEIKIGLRETPPLIMKDEQQDTYYGMSIDYIHFLERHLGVQFKLVYYSTWRELIEKAKKREVDVLATAVWTPERSAWLNYTRPYIILVNKIIAKQGAISEIDSLEKLQRKKVGVLDGSALHQYLKRYQGLLTVVPIRNESLALTDVSFGAIDAAVMDIARASYYIRKENITNLVAIGTVDYNYEYGFSSRKDWPLLADILEKGLATITAEEREAIFHKWVVPLSPGVSILKNRTFWISVGGTGIAVFTVMILLWNRTLRQRVIQSTAELSVVNKQLRQRHEETFALFTVSTVISRFIHMDKLLEEVLNAVSGLELFHIVKGGIFILEDDRLKLCAQAGPSDAFPYVCDNINVEDYLCGTAVRTGEIILSENPAKDGKYIPACSTMPPSRNVIVPLKTKDRVEGVLDLYLPVETEIQENTLKLLATIGNQLGIAIENARLYEKTKARSLHDALTNLWNHEEVMRILGQELNKAERDGTSVAVIMADLDHFKNVNDTYGHMAGDTVLRVTAAKIFSSIRPYDAAGRYGGEEFIIVLPGCKCRQDVAVVAERIRKQVESEYVNTPEGMIPVTISLGIAISRKERKNEGSFLVHAADLALYRAKRNGRNRVEFASDDEKSAPNT